MLLEPVFATYKYFPDGSTSSPSGTVDKSANVETGVSAPDAPIENEEIELSRLLVTYRKLPPESVASPTGLVPTVAAPARESTPAFTANTATDPGAPELAMKRKLPEGVNFMPVAVTPMGNGDPTAVKTPVLEEIENAEMLFDGELVATYKNAPAGSMARKSGVPFVVIRGVTSVRVPLETVNNEISLSPEFAT
jgi:hypothetical protein